MKKIIAIIVCLLTCLTAYADSEIESAIETAYSMLGHPYVFGTSGSETFDCSGFTRFCYELRDLPHSAKEQGYNGDRIERNDLTRGDLVFFDTVKDDDLCDHVGIYLGNNEFIHASSGKGEVTVSNINSKYYSQHFSWGRRL